MKMKMTPMTFGPNATASSMPFSSQIWPCSRAVFVVSAPAFWRVGSGWWISSVPPVPAAVVCWF